MIGLGDDLIPAGTSAGSGTRPRHSTCRNDVAHWAGRVLTSEARVISTHNPHPESKFVDYGVDKSCAGDLRPATVRDVSCHSPTRNPRLPHAALAPAAP